MSFQSAVDVLRDFSIGSLSSDACFCMVLSLLGEEQTKLQFHNALKTAGLLDNGLLWKQLHDIFTNYFSTYNPQLHEISPTEAASFGEQLDLELAIALSEADNELSSATVSATNYSSEQTASAVTYSKRSSVAHSTSCYELPPSSYATDIISNPPSTTISASKLSSAIDKVSKMSSAIDLSKCSTRPPATASGLTVPSYASSVKIMPAVKTCTPSQTGIKLNGTSGAASDDSRPSQTSKQISTCSSIHYEEQPSNQAGTTELSRSTRRKKKKKKGQGLDQCNGRGPLKHISNKPVIYWLRRDLRLHDNPALVAAFESCAPVIFAFLWNEGEEGADAAGGATKLWLHFALSELDKAVQMEYSNRIVFRQVASSQKEILSLVSEVGAGSVLMNNLYEPCLKARDDKISATLQSCGVEVKRFDSYLLHEPESVSSESLGMRGIGSVTHFMECCRQSSTKPIGFPMTKPPSAPASSSVPFSQPLRELGLSRMPQRKDGTVVSTTTKRSRVDVLNTSRISPYLHFGQVSPRTVLRQAQGLKAPKFLRKLAWRDLSYWLLHKFPDMPSKPLRVHYQGQRWSQNKAHLKSWQKGRTGYPLVDAAMRQLWLTGWMNNYARHVVASFLISYLHLHWVHGYKWFQDTLLDADVAINAMMWQNGGMSGLDQWNFVMHPVDAALTCDPNGQYVRQWCPELSGLPDDLIHKPWKCPQSILRRAGVKLGENYPHRIITELEEAREQSLHDVVTMRLQNSDLVDPCTGNDLIPLPTGLLLPVITRKEFKYRTRNPGAKDNPHSAVLKGYRSRKRDEVIAFSNQVDFTASTLSECALRHKRYEQSSSLAEV